MNAKHLLVRSRPWFILLATMIGLACGSRPSGSRLQRLNAETGTLYVQPEGDVTGGQVTYYVYENGVITYIGDVSYNISVSGLINQELQPSFTGRYRASAASVSSATYRKIGANIRQDKAMFTVEALDEAAATATIAALAPAASAFGTIVLDLSQSTIRIKSAVVTGETIIGRRTIRLTDEQPHGR